jgi:hypothetical protein
VGLRQHEGREDEWTIRIWKDDERVVAWSWLKGDRGLLELDVGRDRLDLLDEILADPDARTTVAFDDDEEVRAALRRNGFAEDEDAALTRQGSVMHFLARDLPEAPEPPVLPDGFRYRTVEPDDLAERVAIHRDVWAPSRVTETSFANVQDSWPYRASLDCVVEAPDGRFAAYCLVWPDDENRVGELEPVLLALTQKNTVLTSSTIAARKTKIIRRLPRPIATPPSASFVGTFGGWPAVFPANAASSCCST